MPKISAVIIAKNEEEKIEDCLKSVNWVEEVILIDNGSTDKTKEIGLKYGAKVYSYPKEKYSGLRNAGLKHALGEWVLYVDADERVTPDLHQEIVKLLNGSILRFNTYALPRKNIVLGKELRYGGFGKFDYVKRLFKREALRKWTGELHEEPNFLHKNKVTIGRSGEVGHLKNKLIHIKASSISEMVKKTNVWSETEARLMFDAHHPSMNIPRFLSAICREFWFRMIKQKAFLDGSIGVIHAIYQVYSRFISYAKLWEMQINKRNTNVHIRTNDTNGYE